MNKLNLISNPNFENCIDIKNCPTNAEFWCRVKDRFDAIILLLKCIEYTCTFDSNHNRTDSKNYLIFNDDNKFYIQVAEYTFDGSVRINSISCPFTYKKEAGSCYFQYLKGNDNFRLDANYCSDLINIFKIISDERDSETISCFLVEEIIDGYFNSGEIYLYKKEQYSQIVFFLLSKEMLFTRVDHEPIPTISHPQYHIDFTTENHSQYKIGLKRKIDIEEYLGIVDIEKECYFLEH